MSRATCFRSLPGLMAGLAVFFCSPAWAEAKSSSHAPPPPPPPQAIQQVAKDTKIAPAPEPGPVDKEHVVQAVGNALRRNHMLDAIDKRGIAVVYRLDDKTSKTEYIVDVREFHIPTKAEKAEKADKLDKVEKAEATRGMKHLF